MYAIITPREYLYNAYTISNLTHKNAQSGLSLSVSEHLKYERT